MPWIRAEADRLRLPEAVELEVLEDEVAARKLAARRERVMEAFYDGLVDKGERDRQLQRLSESEAVLETRRKVVQLPPAIDWTWAPDQLNAVLRALWDRVELGEDLMPVRAVWRVQEWRS